jgi:hypothetical protein
MSDISNPQFGSAIAAVGPPTSLLGSFVGAGSSPRFLEIKGVLRFYAVGSPRLITTASGLASTTERSIPALRGLTFAFLPAVPSGTMYSG